MSSTPSQNQNNGENSGEGKEPEQVNTTPVQLSGMVMGSGRWFGYDLQEKHVITTVYFTPKASQGKKVELTFYGYKAPGDDSQFYQVTNLPTVVINTQGGKAITSKTTEVSSNVYIISREGKDLLSTTQTGVRGRGNASWDFPKKPYRIKFAEKHRVLGAPANDK